MIETVVREMVIPIVLAIVTYLLGRANKKADERDQQAQKAVKDTKALKDGVCALLRVQLIEYHDRYVAEERIPHYVFDNYESMYNAYHELGGNGTVTAMYKKVKQLDQY